MRKINEDIKNNTFEKIYLIYGTEEYLKKQYKDKLKKAICGDDTMNLSYFEGKGCNIKEIIDIAETLPFFADRRLVIMEHSGFFKSASEEISKHFCEYIKTVPETTCLVFIENEIDKRGKLFKTVKDIGYISEMTEQNHATLERWIEGIIKENGKRISKQDAELFLKSVGTDMVNISKELEKLICYCLDREVILAEDIEKVCSIHISSRIFDMIDAMAGKDRKKALALYYDLIAMKEPPMRILFMLARQFNIMLQVCELNERGIDNSTIASKAAVQPFIVGKILRQLKGGFTRNVIIKALKDCVNIENDIKNGRMDEKAGVEMILIKYS